MSFQTAFSSLITKINNNFVYLKSRIDNFETNWSKVSSSYTKILSSLNLNYGSDYTVALTNILPNDNNIYEMIVSARVTPDTTSGHQSYCRINIAIDGDTSDLRLQIPGVFLGNVRNRGNQDYVEGSSILFAKRNDKIVVSRSSSIYGTLDLWILAIKKVR